MIISFTMIMQASLSETFKEDFEKATKSSNFLFLFDQEELKELCSGCDEVFNESKVRNNNSTIHLRII